MKHVKDRMKDGLMLIVMMVGVMIAGMTLTACSDEEEMPDINHGIACTLGNPVAKGIIMFDSLVNSKIFYSEDWETGDLRIFIPDTLIGVEEGPVRIIWRWVDIDRNTNSFIYTDTITVEGNKYLRVPCITEIRPTGLNSRSEITGTFCGTTGTSTFAPIDWSSLLKGRTSGGVENNYYPINVYYHGIQYADGAAISSPTYKAEDIIYELNSYYSGTGIYFILKDASLHKVSFTKKNGILTDVRSTLENYLFNLDRHYNGIDVYELLDYSLPADAINSGYVVGRSDDIGSTAFIVISRNYRNMITAPHEMGHCLGLYHTHHGTDPNERSPEKNGRKPIPEYADGSNGETAGDYIPDTPADPNLWKNGEYDSSIGKVDGKGQPYNPDPTLIMSYSQVGNRFSPMQITAMQYHINNEAILKSTLAEYTVTGPASKHFKNSTTLTFKQNDNLESVIWTIVHKSAPAGAEEGALVETTETLYGTNITVSSSKSEIIEATPRVMRMQHGRTLPTFMMTSGAPSPFTGQLLWESTGGQHGVTTNMSHGEPLSVSGDVTINLSYLDLAGATLSGLDYRIVTAANRMLSGKTMTLNKADCAQGFLKVRTYDDCGQSDGYFTIPVTVYGAYYSVNVADGSVTFDSRMGAVAAGGQQKAPATKRAIKGVTVYDATGAVMSQTEAADGSMSAAINTAGWPKGEYKAVVSDGNGYAQEILFAI